MPEDSDSMGSGNNRKETSRCSPDGLDAPCRTVASRVSKANVSVARS